MHFQAESLGGILSWRQTASRWCLQSMIWKRRLFPLALQLQCVLPLGDGEAAAGGDRQETERAPAVSVETPDLSLSASRATMLLLVLSR